MHQSRLLLQDAVTAVNISKLLRETLQGYGGEWVSFGVLMAEVRKHVTPAEALEKRNHHLAIAAKTKGYNPDSVKARNMPVARKIDTGIRIITNIGVWNARDNVERRKDDKGRLDAVRWIGQ